jgi:hypothetical protein
MFDELKDPLGDENNGPHDEASLDAFAANIAAPLKKAERVDRTFEARVMSAISMQAAPDKLKVVRVSSPQSIGVPDRRPARMRKSFAAFASGLAAAAVLLFVVIGNRGQARESVAQDVINKADTVSFTLYAPEARSVSIVGGFNTWDKAATSLTRSTNAGVWTVSLSLPPGRHEYAFIVSDEGGERWVPDPAAITMRDEFGTESSIRMIGQLDESPAGN